MRISQVFERKKLRRTPQRIEIIKFLEGNRSHPSAYDVYKHIKRIFPDISFATVYNNLQKLSDEGLIQKIEVDPERTRFDPVVRPHAHFYCENCGQVFDIELDINDIKRESGKDKFLIERAEISLYGVCSVCLNKKRGKQEF